MEVFGSGQNLICPKCQSCVDQVILPLHSAFCMGAVNDVGIYSDEQVYLLGKALYDYNLLFPDYSNTEEQIKDDIYSYTQSESQISSAFQGSHLQGLKSGIGENEEEQFQCPQCGDFINYSEYSKHQAECRDQGIKCRYCGVSFPYDLISQHIRFCEYANPALQTQNSMRTTPSRKQLLTGQTADSYNKQNNTFGLSLFNSKSFNLEEKNNNNKQLDTQEFEDPNEDIKEYICTDERGNEESISQYGTQYFNMDERTVVNRCYSLRQTTNTQESCQKDEPNNDWSTVSPEQFSRALEVIFPSFKGDRDNFRKNQSQIFRQNLIVRLMNISRYGVAERNVDKKTTSSPFTKIKYSVLEKCDDRSCAICMCDFEEEDDLSVLDCSHRYHEGCIQKWLEKRTTCPICKRDIREFC